MYAGEVSEDSLKAFGISISTRHGKAYELAEMLNFCVAIQAEGLHKKVISLFYDSNSCCCNFELCPSVERYDDDYQAILGVGKKTISQFEWNGSVVHGAPMVSFLEQ